MPDPARAWFGPDFRPTLRLDPPALRASVMDASSHWAASSAYEAAGVPMDCQEGQEIFWRSVHKPLTWHFSVLGGTRTPNLLIRRRPSQMHARPPESTKAWSEGCRVHRGPEEIGQIHLRWLPHWLPARRSCARIPGRPSGDDWGSFRPRGGVAGRRSPRSPRSSRRLRVSSGSILAMQHAAIHESFAGRGRPRSSARAAMVPHVRVTSRSAGMTTTVCNQASSLSRVRGTPRAALGPLVDSPTVTKDTASVTRSHAA